MIYEVLVDLYIDLLDFYTGGTRSVRAALIRHTAVEVLQGSTDSASFRVIQVD